MSNNNLHHSVIKKKQCCNCNRFFQFKILTFMLMIDKCLFLHQSTPFGHSRCFSKSGTCVFIISCISLNLINCRLI